MSEPHKEFLRWSDMTNWLGEKGLSLRAIKQMIKTGRIKRYRYQNNTKFYYLKQQIKQDILNER